jgi:DNA-directed RNA polymerase specialized sigma24 family protein
MYPSLLARAREITHSREQAEDLVQGAFLACLAKPPQFRSNSKLRNWMRIVMANLNAREHRRDPERIGL